MARCLTMLLFSFILAARLVASFNFTNSTITSSHNITSITASVTLPPLPVKSKVSSYHNITSITSPPRGTPLNTAAVVSSQTSINDTDHSCDLTTQDCSPAEGPAFDTNNGTYYNPYYDTTDINPNDNQTLRDICANAFDVSLSNWLTTAQTTEHPTASKVPPTKRPPIISKGAGNSSVLVSPTHVKRNESSVSSTTQPLHITSAASDIISPHFPFTASQPCCYNCTISGGPLQLFQWPTQTVPPPTSTYVNNLNFTL